MKSCATSRAARRALLLCAVFAIACSDDNNDPGPPGPPPASCSTSITSATDGQFVELCAVDGAVRHVRIENLVAPATHASAQVVFGFDVPPTSPTQALEADQFRVLLYGGGMPAPAALIQASYGAVDAALDGQAAFLNTGATVCFDLHDGDATTAPAFILWVDGQRGADCDTPATLTGATAYGARTFWHGTTGAVDKAARLYFRQASGTGATPTVTLSNTAVLSSTDIAAATTCATVWAVNTDWQQLCTPATGMARHVRIEAAASAANNSYFYAVIGQEPGPTGNPAPAAGKFIFTGGRSNSGSSWTWFRFGTGSTTQFNYATDAGAALYVDGPSTICFDLGSNDEGNARVLFWASGASAANCGTLAGLTAASALYDSTTDPATAAIWDAPFATGLLNFVKTNNANATMGTVTVSSEPAAL